MKNFGFSTLEIIIALALLAVIITTALQTIYMAEYWLLSSQVSGEALALATVQLELVRSLASNNFYAASSSPLYTSKSRTGSSTASCSTSFCYEHTLTVSDPSSCAKNLQTKVSWRFSARYSTTSVGLATALTNPAEVLALGGDCLLTTPVGNWVDTTLVSLGTTVRSAQFSSGIDVLGNYIYQTASSTPQLSIYRQPPGGSGNPILVGTSPGTGRRLNAIDVIADSGTGRIYAYVMQHASSAQLAVFDVTNVGLPGLLTTRTLLGVDSNGSFPEGWRVLSYGKRLYAFTRETAGAELHIFDTTRPEQPIEMSSGLVNLNRTVNDVLVREQFINNVKRRFLVLAGSADLKELGIFEVTNDVPLEVVALNLPGTEDAMAVSLLGNTLYLGRRATSGGPELYQFDLLSLLQGTTSPQATSEVGADVSTIRASGPVLYLGTNRSAAEFQVWHSSAAAWSSTTANAARISTWSVPRLAPLGVELSPYALYTQSQSATQPEQLVVISTP